MIFVFLVLWFFILAFIPSSSKNKKVKTVCCALSGAALAFVAGFRSSSVGADTPGYVRSFQNAQPLDWNSFIGLFGKKEPLYYTLTGTLRHITDNYTVLFLIIAAFFITAVCYFIKKYSSNILISFILFMSMGYFSFSMAGLRQTIAMGFMILALDRIINKKYLSFVILILIATGFHVTSLIFFLVGIVYFVPLNAVYITGSIILSMVMYLGGLKIVKPIIDFVWGETRNYDEEFGGISTLILLIVVIIAVLIFYPNIYKYHKIRKKQKIDNLEIDSLFLKLLLLSVPFQIMAIYQANAFRVAMLFHFSIIALIPNTLRVQKDATVKYGGSAVVLLAILYQLFMITMNTAGIMPFSFAWQNNNLL